MQDVYTELKNLGKLVVDEDSFCEGLDVALSGKKHFSVVAVFPPQGEGDREGVSYVLGFARGYFARVNQWFIEKNRSNELWFVMGFYDAFREIGVARHVDRAYIEGFFVGRAQEKPQKYDSCHMGGFLD